MRHRPGLCVSGRRREARPPLLTGGFSPLSEKRCQSNKRPETPHLGGVRESGRSCFERCSPQDVPVGHLDLGEPEGGERPDQHHHTGDDRRRTVGVEPRDLASPVERERGQIARAWRASARRTAGGPRRRDLRRRGRCRRTASRCRPRRPRRSPARARARGRRRRARRRPPAVSARSSSAVGGSVCRWRSEWRTTPTWVETWKATSPRLADHELGRAAADVDHEQPLAGGRGACGGGAEVGQARLLVAARGPWPSRPKRVAHGVRRTPRRWTRRAPPRSSPPCVALRAVGRDRRRRSSPSTAKTRSRGASPSAPVASTPSPRRVTIERRSTSVTRSSSTSAISSRVEFVPMSTTATRVSWPGGASARRRARRAGCRRRSRSSGGACAPSPSRRGGRRAGSARAAADGRRAAARAR